MQATGGKKRFRIDDYIASERANSIIQTINAENQALTCICHDLSKSGGLTCFKCQTFIHLCLAPKPNRDDKYECASCLNKAMDPIFQVANVLRESYVRTQSIFQYINSINLEFILKPQDKGKMIELRGLHSGNTSMSWPMQGGFTINDQMSNFYDFKPLLINSNRKARRQENFIIPEDKLKVGKNYLKFRIPCLDKHRFISSYQYEEKKEYYFAINMINRITANELENIAFRTMRTEKVDSLKLLKQNNSDIQVTQNKVNLMCPYTRQRIKVPVRGRYCKHFSCICLQTLIATHQSSRAWNCPLCDCRLNQPYVDVWIYDILIDNQKGSQVLIKQNGNYQWVQESEEGMVDLDSDSESDSRIVIPKGPEKMAVQPLANPFGQEIIIELEDDSEPQHQPNIPNKKQSTGMSAFQIANSTKFVMSDKQIKQERIKKQKQAFERLKEKQRSSSIHENSTQNKYISGSIKKDLSSIINQEKGQPEKKTSFQDCFKEQLKKGELRKLEERSREKTRPIKEVIIYDIKELQVRELKPDEFRKKYFRNKENKYKKYVQYNEMSRLFKEII